jgi:hypothetical protein
VHKSEQIFDLVHLDVGRPEEFGRGSVVVYDRNRQDFARHHLFDVLLRLFVLKDL